MSSTHEAWRLRGPMSPSVGVSMSLKAFVAITLAAAAAAFLVGFPLGTSDKATAAASPAAPVPEPTPAPVVAVPSVGTPCELNGWPYVDWRCTGAPTGEHLRQVRVIRLDRVAPATLVTPVANTAANVAARNDLALPAGSQNRTSAAASSTKSTTAIASRDHGRIKVTARTVPTRSLSSKPRERTARAAVTASHGQVQQQPSAAPASRGRNLDALAYGETPRRTNTFFGLTLTRDSALQ